MAGSPELSAYVSGTNEFAPGDTVSLPVTVENTGVNEYKFIQSGVVDRDDLPNTAKFLTVTLDAAGTPVIVKSDPQLLGDLRASSTARCSYTIKIPSDAPSGTYKLSLVLNYSYLDFAEQYGTDAIRYYYKNVNKTVSLPITVKPHVKINIQSAETSQVNAGIEGKVVLSVENAGHENGKKTILKIARNGNSPIIPTESSVYIGDFPTGGIVSGTFRVQVSESAEDQVYPLDVYATYEDKDGDTVTSDTETIGVPVGRKADFAIISDPVERRAGQKSVITVLYKNTGGTTVYNAEARISAVDPFSCSDDVAFLGTVAPGEAKEAAFEIDIEGSATPKEYGLDSEIRYRDALDNSRITDPLKISIRVVPDPGPVAGLLRNPLVAGLIAVLIVIGAVFAARRYFNRSR